MHRRQIVSCSIALHLLVATQAAMADDVDDIRNCFDEYKKAILAQNGAAAVTKVDSRTLAYYGRIRSMALTAPAADVRKLPLMDKLMVLSVRHRVPAKKVNAMNDKTMFIHAVNESWIGKEGVRTNDLGEVTVDGEKAVGEHVISGFVTPLRLSFYKEQGEWKFNLTDMMPEVGKGFAKVIVDSGKSEDEFLVSILQLTTGTAVQESVWEPLAPEER